MNGVSSASTQDELLLELERVLAGLGDAGPAGRRLAGWARLLRCARLHPSSVESVRTLVEMELARVLLAGATTRRRAGRPSGAGTE